MRRRAPRARRRPALTALFRGLHAAPSSLGLVGRPCVWRARLAPPLLLLLGLGAAAGAPCAAVFGGVDCGKAKPGLPQCVNGAFGGGWITLHTSVLGSGDGRKWQVGKKGTDVPHAIAQKLPDTDVFGGKWEPTQELGKARFNSCALVSSSSALRGRKLGGEIDAHEIVMRLNNAPTKGHEPDVGSRTSVRFTNEAYQGFREAGDEAVIGKWRDVVDAKRDKRLLSMMAKKLHPMNPAFTKYVDAGFMKAFKGEHPTSGFINLLLLAHVCARVDAYGFTGKSLKSWYFPKRKQFKGRPPPKKAWLREKSWTVDHWHVARRGEEPVGAVPTHGVPRGGGEARGARAGRRLLHELKGERRCMRDLADAGVVNLL